jgi:hypothetical protein
MIRIAITAEAFDTVAAMLPSGNVLYKRERTAQGGYFVWLDDAAILGALRLNSERSERQRRGDRRIRAWSTT